MKLFFLKAAAVYLLLFSLRLLWMGGFDPGYRDPKVDILAPVQAYFDDQLRAVYPYPFNTIVSAMLFGVNHLPYSLKLQFQQTSTIHLMVVSGQNLSLLVGFLMGLVSIIGRKTTLKLSLGMIVFYSVLTGLQLPIIRAAIMAGTSLIGMLIGKNREGVWILLLTLGLMLLYQPNWIFSISFQLSFLATVAVVLVSPLLEKYFLFIPEVVRQDLTVTLSAQLLTLPIIAANFGAVSVSGILVNALILWTVPPIMIIGIVTLLLSVISIFLATILGLVVQILLTYILDIVNLFAQTPQLNTDVRLGVAFWLGYYFLILALLLKIAKQPKYDTLKASKKGKQYDQK
jgi:competence protein ComEC